MKRILLTAVGTRDPYSFEKNIPESEGSILHIIRNFNTPESPITDAYVYLSNVMALQEVNNKAIEQGIKFQDKNINIHFYPENILEQMQAKEEEVRLKKLEENPDINDKDWLKETFNEIQSEGNNVGRVTVNKYGTFYADFYYMLNKIKEQISETEEQYEILVNVSSGTPAMKDDLNLLAITNKDKNLVLHSIQVAGKSSDEKEPPFFYLKPEQIKQDLMEIKSNEEKSKENRSSLEKMTNIKKLLLKDSIDDLFAKKDYAGVYNALDIAFQNNIFEDKKILYLAQNLYYRYIGNERVALEAASNLEKLHIKRTELYPKLNIKASGSLINKAIEKLIEHANILDVKRKRSEINDWLLILHPLIEFIYAKIIYDKSGLDINLIKDSEEKISYQKFCQQNVGGKYDYLDNIMLEYNTDNPRLRRFVNAEFLKRILHKINLKNNDKELDNLILFLDALREYRNEAAHELSFINEEKLEKYFREKIKNNVNLQDLLKEKSVIEQTNIIINKLLKQIVPDKKGLDAYRHIYDSIENKIKELINIEVYLERDYERSSNSNL